MLFNPNKIRLNTLDIILPAYNPVSDWEKTVLERFNALNAELKDYSLNLIIVDDGSAESLQPKINFLQQNIKNLSFLKHKKNRGKGAALRTGVHIAKSEIILYTDIDFPYTLESMKQIIKNVQETDCSIAVGKRNKTYYESIPKNRAWISSILKTTIKTVLRLPAYDTQCGLKAFQKDIQPIFLETKTNRFLVDLEFLRKVNRLKHIKVNPVLVDLRKGIQLSEVSLKLLVNESWSFAKILFS